MMSDRLDDMADAFSDVGGHFTCSEADTLVELLHSLGAHHAARALLDGHTRSDGVGDTHYEGDEPEGPPDMSGPGNPSGDGR